MWKNGMIIQKGYVSVLVEKIKEYQGLFTFLCFTPSKLNTVCMVFIYFQTWHFNIKFNVEMSC